MLQRLTHPAAPHFLFLAYQPVTFAVSTLLALPAFTLTSLHIQRRPPLAPTARRAGWVGCNILLGQVPQQSQVTMVHNGQLLAMDHIKQQWQNTLLLQLKNTSQKAWLSDVMLCIQQLGKPQFTLSELYGFIPWLKLRHPENQHVEAKIRQQLQLLRTAGRLSFHARGVYLLTAG